MTQSQDLRLDSQQLRRGVQHLTRVDRDLASVIQRHGPPPLWARPPGTATLMRIILEQQVSLASAKAVYNRMEDRLGRINAESVASCGVSGLRRLGLTRQKATYCFELADQILSGELSLRKLSLAPSLVVREELQKIKGIGPWSADIYLLMALRHPDVWPTGDIALLTAMQRLRNLRKRPSNEKAAQIAEQWAPWRAVAARILWHGYLEGTLRRRKNNQTAYRHEYDEKDL